MKYNKKKILVIFIVAFIIVILGYFLYKNAWHVLFAKANESGEKHSSFL